MSRMRLTGVLLAVMLSVASALPTQAQPEPLPAPFSPEQRAALPAELRNDPRAFDGAVAFAYLDSHGCAVNQLTIVFGYIAPTDGSMPRIRIVVRQGPTVFANYYGTVTLPSGAFFYTVGNHTSGGAAPGLFPLNPDVTTTVTALLLTEENKPLWYTRATFECDVGDASRTSGPVKILNKNGSFDTAGATEKTASKWAFSSRVKRTCSALPGDCTARLKGKPDKVTSATQTIKHKGGFSDETVYIGFMMVYDTLAASGTVDYSVDYRYPTGISGIGGETTLTGSVSGAFVEIGLAETYTIAEFDRTIVSVQHTGAAAGTVYIRSFYAWAYTP